jgi:hypothetical protein
VSTYSADAAHDDPYAAQVAEILAGADARRNPNPRIDDPGRLRALAAAQRAAADSADRAR